MVVAHCSDLSNVLVVGGGGGLLACWWWWWLSSCLYLVLLPRWEITSGITSHYFSENPSLPLPILAGVLSSPQIVPGLGGSSAVPSAAPPARQEEAASAGLEGMDTST